MITAYFFDSSALVKRYVTEHGSNWVRDVTASPTEHPLIITRLSWVELLGALTRLQREHNLPSADIELVIRNFHYDLQTQYQLIEIDQILTEKAGNLLQRYPLRAYDSIQIAAALKIKSVSNQVELVFVSADNRLLMVAQAEGLRTENPNNQ